MKISGLKNDATQATLVIAQKLGSKGVDVKDLLTGAAVSYTHLRAHETVLDLVCRLLLEKKKSSQTITTTYTRKPSRHLLTYLHNRH